LKKNLLGIHDPIECPNSAIILQGIWSMSSTKVSYSGKCVFHFRIRSIPPFKNKINYISKQGAWQVSCALNTRSNSDRSDGTFNEEIPRIVH
jgi:hypothetical protein